MRILAAFLAFAAIGFSAEKTRDFLTENEIDQVRLAQDPNDRIALYVRFARQRVDRLQQMLAKEKPGRSAFIHDLLEDYTSIIEAIDSVADDSLRRRLPIDKGMVTLASAEKEFIDKLNKIEPAEPKDLSRFQFVLQQAIDTTSDSLELSQTDSVKRAAELAKDNEKAKKERDAMLSTKEKEERKKADKADSEKATTKKIPSLYKPGEKPPDQ